LTFELSGTPDHLRSFVEHISPFGLLELVKSGRIALKRTSTIRPSTVVGAS
jgi:acetolactate synthase small subunit